MNEIPSEAVRRQTIVLIPVYMNIFMIGCGVGWIPNAVYFLLAGDEIHATLFQCSLIIAFSEFGKIIFAIPAGVLTDTYGRKEITISAAVLNLIAFLVLSLNTSLTMMCTGRFIHGLASALIDASALITIGEIASSDIRGRFAGKYNIFMNTAALLTSLTSVIFSSYKMLTYVIAVASFISLISMYWMIETPSFLISASKLQQAKINLQHIRQGYQANEIEEEFDKLQKYIKEEKTRKNQLNSIKFFKSKVIRKPLTIGILSSFFTFITGGSILMGYITSVIPANEFVPKLYYPLIFQIIAVFTSLTIPMYIDKLPRRTIFLFGAATMILLNSICAISNYFLGELMFISIMEWVFTMGNILIRICFINTLQPLNCALQSEIFPQTVKGICGSLGIVSQSTAVIISFQMYHLFEVYSHLYFMYTIFSVNSLIFYLVIYFLLPEARGVSLPDLQMKFKGKPTTQCDGAAVESNSQNSK